MKFVHFLVCGFWAIMPLMAQDNGVAPLPVEIAPNNPNLYYMGRFDMANEAGPTCAWSGSAIGIRFHGTAINAQMTLGSNRFEVIVDGIPTHILTGSAASTFYNLVSGLSDQDHTVMLFKDTEALVGNASFQ